MQSSSSIRVCYAYKRVRYSACAFILALSFALCAVTSPIASDTAFADIRKTDVIYGTTMEARGLQPSMCPSIEADYAYVVDDEGNVYFERDSYSPTQIASITKVMTALVALQNSSLDEMVEVSTYAAHIGESSAQLWPGDELTMEEALKALMIPSGNDAAAAIAEHVGKTLPGYEPSSDNSDASGDTSGSDGAQESGDMAAISAFVKAMNDKALELGCTDTLFENPHGLDEDPFDGNLHSCAADVSLIITAAMQNETFRDIVKTENAAIKIKRGGEDDEIELKSTDELLSTYEGACGVKTGFTEKAGPCFAGACERDGKYLYSVVLHSSSESQRFVDTETLFNWVYENTVSYKLANSSDTISMNLNGIQIDAPVVGYASLSSWIDKTVPVTFGDPSASIDVFALNGNISQDFEFYDIVGSVSAGDVVGKVRFYQRNKQVAEQDLIACQDVEGPSILDGIGISFNRFILSFSDSPTQADSVVINELPLLVDKK